MIPFFGTEAQLTSKAFANPVLPRVAEHRQLAHPGLERGHPQIWRQRFLALQQ
jgi:hypothetical protein